MFVRVTICSMFTQKILNEFRLNFKVAKAFTHELQLMYRLRIIRL